MLSCTIPPSSANSLSRPKHLCEEEIENITTTSVTTSVASVISTLTASTTSTTTTTTTTTSVTTICTTTSSSTTTTGNQTTRPSSITITTATAKHATNERTRSDSNGRSAALERAYVHDVYENCEEPVGSIRPRVAQFLANLDAGSIVCDVGCGNGRYLNSCNPLIYTIGVDRCYRLTKIARAKGGEVALCDNLDLPFRDESFDAVLSLAVVHHFATTERRVGAIRELARILRIGGRVIISVWALEQRHKRFESQDVLVPWQPPKSKNTNTSDEEDDEDFLPPYHAYTEDSTNSSRSAGDGDSSSLSSSSPGESCYSFVRRAIQKLAGGKKHPWFLESWNSKDTKHGSSLEYEDAKDLPIELRRLEDFDDLNEPPLSAGLKSRSLGSILNPPPRTIVRSRSSVPSLGAQIPETKQPTVNATETRRPKLVKQKQSVCEDIDFPLPEELSGVHKNESRILLRKQSSLNEELMAESRLREKERVKKRIQKQMSLNEAFLCRSLFTKRLQVIREGFTTKLKSSTGNLERVTKNGFVKIMQNIKGGQTQTNRKNSVIIPSTSNNLSNGNNENSVNLIYCNYNSKTILNYNNKHMNSNTNSNNINNNNNNNNNNNYNNNSNFNSNHTNNNINSGATDDQKPRRHSRESGSDSSKDSSLQSDTSIESEDSFASVIYIPKPEQSQLSGSLSTTTSTNIGNLFKIPSVPTSPLIMPCPTPTHSPIPQPIQQQQQQSQTSQSQQQILKLQGNNRDNSKFTFEDIIPNLPKSNEENDDCNKNEENNKNKNDDENLNKLSQSKFMSGKIKNSKVKITRQQIKDLPPIPKFKKAPSFPIVRRTSAAPSIPKLLSLEIFNPETDDLDSDSSEPSSPDSIDSVISAPKLVPSMSVSNSSTTHTVSTTPKTINDITNTINSNDKKLISSEIERNHNQGIEIENKKEINDDCPVVNKFNFNSNENYLMTNDINNINLEDNLISDNVILGHNSNKLKCNESNLVSHHNLVDFAEKLNAQLLKELDKNPNKVLSNNSSFDDNNTLSYKTTTSVTQQTIDENYETLNENELNEESETEYDDRNFIKKKIKEKNFSFVRKCSGYNYDIPSSSSPPSSSSSSFSSRDLNNFREELRERRLMLANLNSSIQQHHYHHYYNNHSMSSVRESTSNGLSNNLNSSLKNISTSQADTIHEEDETALLNDFDYKQYDDYDINDSLSNKDTVLLIQDDELNDNSSLSEYNHLSSEHDNSKCKNLELNYDSNLSNVHNKHIVSPNRNKNCKLTNQKRTSNESHQSLDSWENSNSTGSLDSPSVGGSATHHRFYHVFREGELDALINHHVASLHIVSSYYERASWCVVAEKVQVWTI